MKNRGVNLLLAITILFVGITIGFSIGRNANHEPVQLSSYQPPVSTTATQATSSSLFQKSPVSESTSAPLEPATPIAGSKVNVNTADLDTLTTLPGIGPVLAQRIIDYRLANGNFETLEELANVNGIGIKRLEAILDHATVGG